MHHIYHTEGIIMGSRNSGEAGKYYFIFTRDFGMITAGAQGVRKVSSKLRFVLQDFAYLKIDLIQGRDFWRITNAAKTNILEEITKRPANFLVFANVARLLRRLLPGVEPNEALFIDLIKCLSLLEKVTSKEDLRNIEAVIVLRILNNLGYIGGDSALENFTSSPFDEDMFLKISNHRVKILSAINSALKETHL